MHGQPDFAEELLTLFAERGAQTVEFPIIQPADPFLDMAGEDLRRRIFLTDSENGDSLCLRPEFTIPVCRMHIADHAGAERRFAYLGKVFRQRRDGGNEFFQAGIEDLGNPDIAATDARAIRDAIDTLATLLPRADFDITLGDQTLFEQVVAALGLPDGWQTRLIQAFGDHAQLDQMLTALSEPNGSASTPMDDISTLAGAGDREALIERIDARMRATGYLSNASRTPTEIADRLISKTQLAHVHLDAGSLAILRNFLAMETRLSDAPAALTAFAHASGLDLGPAQAGFEARVAALEACGCPITDMHYHAAFGRPLDYYSGLVFEIAADGAVLAGGGRYDRLLTLLGANTPIPGIGFSLWLDRVETVRAGKTVRTGKTVRSGATP